MKHGTLILPAERARYFVELLGRKVQLQIEDMNELSMKRHYRKYIQRYEFASLIHAEHFLESRRSSGQ